MVAFSIPAKLRIETLLPARVPDYSSDSGALFCSKSRQTTGLGHTTYDESFRSDACTRDPIGFRGGLNLYLAYFERGRLDPSGRLAILLPIFVVGCGIASLEGLAASYCMDELGKAHERGRLLPDPQGWKRHCFVNCCHTKLHGGVPVSVFIMTPMEPLAVPQNGAMDCGVDAYSNCLGAVIAVDDLYIDSEIKSDCITACEQRAPHPRSPMVPTPGAPVEPIDMGEATEHFCERTCSAKCWDKPHAELCMDECVPACMRDMMPLR